MCVMASVWMPGREVANEKMTVVIRHRREVGVENANARIGDGHLGVRIDDAARNLRRLKRRNCAENQEYQGSHYSHRLM